ncbi:unnamed protein product, partial [Prorocentrum cordatum]
ALLNPCLGLKVLDSIDTLPPTPKVWPSDEELIASDLLERRIAKFMSYDQICEGEGPQRPVMNVIPSNRIQNTIESDMPMPPQNDKWRSIALHSGEVLSRSSEDL